MVRPRAAAASQPASAQQQPAKRALAWPQLSEEGWPGLSLASLALVLLRCCCCCCSCCQRSSCWAAAAPGCCHCCCCAAARAGQPLGPPRPRRPASRRRAGAAPPAIGRGAPGRLALGLGLGPGAWMQMCGSAPYGLCLALLAPLRPPSLLGRLRPDRLRPARCLMAACEGCAAEPRSLRTARAAACHPPPPPPRGAARRLRRAGGGSQSSQKSLTALSVVRTTYAHKRDGPRHAFKVYKDPALSWPLLWYLRGRIWRISRVFSLIAIHLEVAGGASSQLHRCMYRFTSIHCSSAGSDELAARRAVPRLPHFGQRC
jgi:hypothetical protein